VAYLLNHIDPDTQPVWASESITLKVNQLHRILQGHYPEGLPLQQWIRPLEKLDIPITLRFRKAASEAVAINGLGMGPKTLMLPTWADVETHLQINGHYTGEPEDFAKLVKRAERNGLAALRDPDGNIPYAAVLHWLVKKGKGSPELIRHFGKRDLQTALDWV
jgi:hypothetical protein